MTTTIKHLAIIVRDDAYDRLYTPLTFAWLAARQGVQVDMLFTLWAVRVLTEQGSRAVRMHRPDAQDEALFRQMLGRIEFTQDIGEMIRLVKHSGNVRLYACQAAARLFGVDEPNLLPEAEGIADPLWFITEKAAPADHCQYF